MAESVLGKINYLTEEQYQNAKINGQINENEIYMTPDDEPYVGIITDEITTNEVTVTTASEIKVGTYTIPDDGLYLITGNVPLNHYGQSGRSLHVFLRNNGVDFFSTSSVLNTYAWTVSEVVSYVSDFKKGDVITIFIGSSSNVNWSCGTAKFQFTKIMKTERFVIQNGEHYFAEEEVIGTCLGKPLYKRWVNGTTAAAGNDHFLFDGIDKLIDFHIMVRRSNVNQYHPLNNGMANNETAHVSPLYIDNALHKLFIYMISSYYGNQDFYGWVKYTKITD